MYVCLCVCMCVYVCACVCVCAYTFLSPICEVELFSFVVIWCVILTAVVFACHIHIFPTHHGLHITHSVYPSPFNSEALSSQLTEAINADDIKRAKQLLNILLTFDKGLGKFQALCVLPKPE